MKVLIFCIFLTLSLFQPTFGQNKTKTEQKFFDLETKWMNAWKNKDEATARKIISDDFTLTSVLTTGELTNKETWIEHAFHGFDCKSFSFDTIKVRVYGNTALLNIWWHQVATINGKDWSGNALLTDVWVEKNGEWQVVARATTPLAQK
jgi:ketosteroid isomerase-like protein